LNARVEATAQVLRDLGGDVEVVAEPENRWRIEGNGARCRRSSGIRP
jgi:hypothetical protein